MEEVDIQTKSELVVQYIFYSVMIIMILFVLGSVCIVFRPEEILNIQTQLGVMLGFISFILIMASIFSSNLTGLFDTMDKLNREEYV